MSFNKQRARRSLFHFVSATVAAASIQLHAMRDFNFHSAESIIIFAQWKHAAEC